MTLNDAHTNPRTLRRKPRPTGEEGRDDPGFSQGQDRTRILIKGPRTIRSLNLERVL